MARAKREDRAAREQVRAHVERLRASQANKTRGLPNDILVHALEPYERNPLKWPVVRRIAQETAARVAVEGQRECIIERKFRRPLGKREPAAGISIFWLVAVPLRSSETVFGAHIHTFVFTSNNLWLLTTTDPVIATDHLHQRMIQRAAGFYKSLAEGQDALSTIWPSLVELGNERRRMGRAAAVTTFLSPWGDGLLFGDMGALDQHVDLFRPTLIDFSEMIGIEHELEDSFSGDDKRLLITIRTFVDGARLEDDQRRVREQLAGYVRRHSRFVSELKHAARLAYDVPRFGPMLRQLFSPDRVSQEEHRDAMEELDAITSSDEWRSVVERSVQSRRRREVSTE